ncbi:MAG: DUF512 domain-containing protein [Bacteroides sp.]|nr:DUF512 domain-containing protein [Eubacterium sp.]MCM1418598.1 DUF512 domain-containing protein [Roseburia sp.]MCM1462652.1 DUF512 domain-containing protein [Bacteroides sp.]
MSVKILSVTPRSPASRAGIRAGDELVAIDGNPIRDALDYGFYTCGRVLRLTLADRTVILKKKDDYDEPGLNFESFLMDRKQSCRNKCLFCFIDQLPPGLRETLYFKDDDSRLSFFQGNYITLTNLDDADIERIIQMKLNVNISVHTTDPDLRVKMLKNKNAGKVLTYLPRLAEAGITMNCQIVLCRGVNDGEALEKTLADLTALYPSVQSIAVVPFGATKYRDGLPPIPLHDKASARAAVETIERCGDEMLKKYGERVVYPADELFLTAELPLPDGEYYGAYDQYENGVGMWTYLREGYLSCLDEVTDDGEPIERSIATGLLAAPLLRELAEETMRRFPSVKLRVFAIRNDFFGETITVAGLITGRDLIARLLPEKDRLGTRLVIPKTMLKADEAIFLDDTTLAEVEAALGVPVYPVGDEGEDLIEGLLG